MMRFAFGVSAKDATMTLEDAVAILNERRHREQCGWHIIGKAMENRLVCGEGQYESFEPFEAIAVAEKYVRESKRTRSRLPP